MPETPRPASECGVRRGGVVPHKCLKPAGHVESAKPLEREHQCAHGLTWSASSRLPYADDER